MLETVKTLVDSSLTTSFHLFSGKLLSLFSEVLNYFLLHKMHVTLAIAFSDFISILTEPKIVTREL